MYKKKEIQSKVIIVIALITMVGILSAKSLAGVSTGNGADEKIPFRGLNKDEKPSEELGKYTRTKNLYYNKVDFVKHFDFSAELHKKFIYKINAESLFKSFRFDGSKEDVASLYRKAINKEGDYSSIKAIDNPFSKYLSNTNFIGDYIIDIDSLFNFPTESKLTVQINVNNQISDGNCSLCSLKDYKPIPSNGIALDVKCKIMMIENTFGEHGDSIYDLDKNSSEFLTNIKLKIRSQTDKIEFTIPALTKEMVEIIRHTYSQKPDAPEIDVTINCYLDPSTKRDEEALKSSFNLSQIYDWSMAYRFTFDNFKLKNSLNYINALDYLRNDSLQGYYDYIYDGTSWLDGHTKYKYIFKALEFRDSSSYRSANEKNFYDKVINRTIVFKTAGELAEMIRVNFISSYVKWKAEEEEKYPE